VKRAARRRPAPARRAPGLAEIAGLARAARESAHAPFSGFKVGAALRAKGGEVVTGCNVENASYGLTLCAECGLVSDLVRTGGGRLVAVSCVGGDERPLMPCGRCRQLLWEHGGPEMLLETVSLGIRPMRDVLPDAFGPEALTAASGREG
jgi:cytidine deaminase